MQRFKTTLVSFLFSYLFVASSVFSQSCNDGAVSPTMLKQIKASVVLDGATKAMINAVSNNSIKKLSYNRELAGKTDHFFKYRVKAKGITHQKSSGRCWLFTSLNVLRPKVIEKHNLKEFFFCENYSFFWDQFEKANLFLEGIITTRNKNINDREVEWLFKHPIQDGGIWNYAVELTEKYGVIPQGVMSETYNSENTGMMRRLLRRKLKEHGLRLRQYHVQGKNLSDLRKEKVEMLSEIYRMLVINLGVPPEEFTWRYEDAEGKLSDPQKFTPQSFFKEFVGVNMRDYVQLMNDPSKEYFKLYEIKTVKLPNGFWRTAGENLPVMKVI